MRTRLLCVIAVVCLFALTSVVTAQDYSHVTNVSM